MPHLTILVPTRNRLAKLRRMLATIPRSPLWNVHLICDGDPDTHREFLGVEGIGVTLIDENVGFMAAANSVVPALEGDVMYCTDDVEFIGGGIPEAYAEFRAAFPDHDGVLGITQSGPHANTGIAIIGEAFLDRYPGRLPFFPEYRHFGADYEVGLFAESLGRLSVSSNALINHHHPDFEPQEMDQTHRDARVMRREDLTLLEDRKRRGIIWPGESAYA